MKSPYHAGFTYIGLLFMLVIIGIMLAMAGTLWSFAQKRETERQLVFVGNQFKRAIGQYYEKTPGTLKRYPNSFEDLLQDNRYVSTQRYLRDIYMDPVSHSKKWGIVRAADGGIMGIYSLSNDSSVRKLGFADLNNIVEKIDKYSDWKFVYNPVVIAAPQGK